MNLKKTNNKFSMVICMQVVSILIVVLIRHWTKVKCCWSMHTKN